MFPHSDPHLDVGVLHVDDLVEVGLGGRGVADEQVEGGAEQQGLCGVAASGLHLFGALADDLIVVLLLHVLLGLQVARAKRGRQRTAENSLITITF